MNKYEIYYKNNTYEIKKGRYLYIDKVNNILIIDNIKIADLKDILQIMFLIKGYYQVINL